MSFSIAAIFLRLIAPRHELSCPSDLWSQLTSDLRRRGQGKRESGAFLLGRAVGGRARISGYVLYDDLDPESLTTGIVNLDGRHFGKLWQLCADSNLSVVADIHTHPFGSEQSLSDRANPIIARQGHIALIVPNFAKAPVELEAVGIYRYEGRGAWTKVPKGDRRTFFRVGYS